jgi:hypothetical protein
MTYPNHQEPRGKRTIRMLPQVNISKQFPAAYKSYVELDKQNR